MNTRTDALDALVADLDAADLELRAVYGTLAEDPDLANEFEAKIVEARARRLDLAMQVGLAVLARTRAERRDPCEPNEPAPAPEPVDVVPEGSKETPEDPSDPVEPTPQADRPSSEDLATWKEKVRANGFGRAPSASDQSASWLLTLNDLMNCVGGPRDLDSSVQMIEEADALDAVGVEDRQIAWSRLARDARNAWIGLLVARTRALKDHPSATPETAATVKRIIRRYPAWTARNETGHVNGLRVAHAPLHGSWAADARHYWEMLSNMLGEERPLVTTPTAKKRKEKQEKAEDDCAIDPAWPLFKVIAGLNAVMLGGDPREPNRERLERTLQLASLDWPPIDGSRRVDAVVERIRKGTYGLVLVLGTFVLHKQSNPIIEAARSSGIRWALVEGYGVAAVRLGLERFLGGTAPVR